MTAYVYGRSKPPVRTNDDLDLDVSYGAAIDKGDGGRKAYRDDRNGVIRSREEYDRLTYYQARTEKRNATLYSAE